MANYITIDGGTTNTRINLIKDCKMVDSVKLNVGARTGIDDNAGLKKAIKDGINKILENNRIEKSDIKKILASGMITSESGVCKLDHIVTPAGISELNKSMYEVVINEISDIPIVFIRGVKTECKTLETADMMRGEETELMGIMSDDDGECAYILPGSHSKIIYTDSRGRIESFSTMLTGEMIASISQNTILKDAVDLSVSDMDEEYLMKGYTYCENKGINEALFKTRVLKNLFGCNKEQTYSYFLGVILYNEIAQVIASGAGKIIIGGKSQIKSAMAYILKKVSDKKVICLDDEKVDMSTSLGMIKVYEY